MGTKRLGRRRLAAIEKLGILKDISTSSAMGKAVVSATQHREGQKVTTDLVLDLGSSTAGLKVRATGEKFPIGTTTSAPSYVCRVTDAVFGVVTAVDVVCLEAISDGTLTDFDVMFATGADGDLDTEATGDTAIKTAVGALGYHDVAAYDAQELKDKYIYVTSGAATSQKASAVIDCTDAVVGNLADGVDTIRLIDSGGAAVLFVAESDTAFGGTAQANKFNIDGLATPANLATSLKLAIDNNAAFDAVVTDSVKVTVTHAASTATSNHQAGYLLNDDPQAPNGISIGAFTGGIDDGQAISSGKLLLRFTGFIAFDDI